MAVTLLTTSHCDSSLTKTPFLIKLIGAFVGIADAGGTGVTGVTGGFWRGGRGFCDTAAGGLVEKIAPVSLNVTLLAIAVVIVTAVKKAASTTLREDRNFMVIVLVMFKCLCASH